MFSSRLFCKVSTVAVGLVVGMAMGVAKEGKAQDNETVKPYALPCTSAPGPWDSGSTDFYVFPLPTINADGGIAFRSITSTTCTGAGEVDAIFAGDPSDPSSLAQIVKQGDIALLDGTTFGDQGIQYSGNFEPVINASGDIAFRAVLSDGRSGIWTGKNSSTLTSVAISGELAGSTGTTFCSFGGVISGYDPKPLLNDAGQVAFYAGLTGAGGVCDHQSSIWLHTPGELLTLVARVGDPVEGTDPVQTLYPPVLSNSGHIAFIADLGNGAPNFGDTVYSVHPTTPSVEKILAKGDPTPAGGEVGLIKGFSTAINASGDLAFDTQLYFVPGASWGIWKVPAGGAPDIAVKGGDFAPGLPGNDFGLFGGLLINNSGDLAFRAVHAGGYNAIWAKTSTGLSLMADTLNGLSGDLTYTGLFLNGFNSQGKVLYRANKPGGHSLWVGDSSTGDQTRVAITGETVEFQPSDDRAITWISNNARGGSNNDGKSSGFDDKGRLALMLQLTNVGSSIYVAGTNSAPVANAGSDISQVCTSVSGTNITLDGSGSSDPDGDPLSYAWSGPNGLTATGVSPVVSLPLGTSTVSLVVNDGEEDSAPETVNVTVTANVSGLKNPFADLVPSGDPVPLPDKAFKQGRTLPLKLDISCGGQLLGDQDVSAPVISALSLTDGAPVDLGVIDLDAGEANDNGIEFRFSDTQWVYNLSTKALAVGTYEIEISMPDGLSYVGKFVLK